MLFCLSVEENSSLRTSDSCSRGHPYNCDILSCSAQTAKCSYVIFRINALKYLWVILFMLCSARERQSTNTSVSIGITSHITYYKFYLCSMSVLGILWQWIKMCMLLVLAYESEWIFNIVLKKWSGYISWSYLFQRYIPILRAMSQTLPKFAKFGGKSKKNGMGET